MAISATTIWEVETGGSDTLNGGGFDPKVAAPGTDFSTQAAAAQAYSDLVIGNPTNTQLTSAAHPFSSTSPGNIINITGGTGFTTGRYEILSVSGTTATMDRAVGTAGSTGGSGNLGGALASPGQASAAMVAGNIIYVKSGTYTINSTSVNVAGGGVQMPAGNSDTAPSMIIGYTSSRTVLNTDTAPTFALGVNSAIGVTAANNFQVIRNIAFTNTTFTTTVGVDVTSTASNVLMEKLQASGVSNGFIVNGTSVHLINCYSFNCSAVGFNIQPSAKSYSLIQCTADTCGSIGNNFAGFLFQANNAVCIQCIACNNNGPGFDQNFSNTSGGIFMACSASGNVGTVGYGFQTGTGIMILVNSVAFGNSQDIRDNLDTTPNYLSRIIGSAAQLFTTGSFTKNSNIISLAQLTANPFNNPGGKDFSLNNVPGGGQACQGFGFPQTFLGIPTASFWDAGAAQHKVP